MLPGARPRPTGTSTGITVSIARDPALVRTVRLVAAAVARRASVDEDFVEEVRLAVGEACALLVGSSDESATVAAPETGNDPADLVDPADPVDPVDPVDPDDPAGPAPASLAAAGPVEVRMTLEDRLRVVVSAGGSVAVDDPPTSDIDGIEPWALLRGLIEDFSISVDATGTVLSMSWPVG